MQGGPSASGKNYVDGNWDIAPGWIEGAFIRDISFRNYEQNDDKKNLQ